MPPSGACGVAGRVPMVEAWESINTTVLKDQLTLKRALDTRVSGVGARVLTSEAWGSTCITVNIDLQTGTTIMTI